MGFPHQGGLLGGRLTPAADTGQAAWLDAIIDNGRVSTIIPPVFEAYARVFHPATDDEGNNLRWSDIAAFNGRAMHPRAQFPRIAPVISLPDLEPCNGQPWTEPPEQGTLPSHIASSVAEILGQFSAHRDCWFAVWPGFADVDAPLTGPNVFAVPRREYALYSGQLDDAAVNLSSMRPWRHQSATAWWPSDRSWFVATDIDFVGTYIGGTRACTNAILASPHLESLPSQATHFIDFEADEINPADWWRHAVEHESWCGRVA